MECPYCNKELQVRGMFAHIRKFHNDELLKNTSRQWIEDAENGKPLRVWWSKKNDFDEDEETVIFVCLSTNKTFMTELKAQQHFAKEKAALKDHNKQLKQLKKDYEAMKKAAAKAKKQAIKQDPYILRRQAAFDSNDPELARAIWRGILNNKKTCECAMMLCNRRRYRPETPVYMLDTKQGMFEQVPFYKLQNKHEKLMLKIQTLEQAKCMDAKLLDKVYKEVLSFWIQDYQESMMGFHDDMRNVQPLYNYQGEEKFFHYATEEMEGVGF